MFLLICFCCNQNMIKTHYKIIKTITTTIKENIIKNIKKTINGRPFILFGLAYSLLKSVSNKKKIIKKECSWKVS